MEYSDYTRGGKEQFSTLSACNDNIKIPPHYNTLRLCFSILKVCIKRISRLRLCFFWLFPLFPFVLVENLCYHLLLFRRNQVPTSDLVGNRPTFVSVKTENQSGSESLIAAVRLASGDRQNVVAPTHNFDLFGQQLIANPLVRQRSAPPAHLLHFRTL